MPQNTVRSILQTPDGYLWMTTLDGLARFDGVHFTVFNKLNTPELASNRLAQSAQSSDGDLWISAESDFVTRYHAGKFVTYTIGENAAQNDLIRNLVMAFAQR